MNYKVFRGVFDSSTFINELIKKFEFRRVEVVNMAISRAAGDVNISNIEVEKAARFLQPILKDYIDFNDFSIIYYKDGDDWVGWHSDGEYLRTPHSCTGTLSFGASREILFRPKGSIDHESVILNHGDLLVMDEHFQELNEHMVPKSDTRLERYVLALYTRRNWNG